MKKTRTQIGSILMALVLVLTLLPATAIAEEPDVAESSDAYKQLLADIQAAPANGTQTKVTLAGDITDMTTNQIIEIGEGQNIVLDMNGYSITVASNDFSGRPIVNYGTLTVTGNGTIDSSMATSVKNNTVGYGAIDNFGTLLIVNGTYKGSVFGGAAIRNKENATLTIEDGYFESNSAIYNFEGATATINGGEFKSEACNAISSDTGAKGYYAYAVISAGNLYFNDGKITGVQGALAINNGYAEVKDGTFETVLCEHASNAAFYALYIAGERGQVSATISGGTFKSATRVAVNVGNDNTGGDGGLNLPANAVISGGTFIGGQGSAAALEAPNTGTLQITGGTFSSNVSDYVADGYETVQQGDQWVVGTLDDLAVAQVGDQKYITLPEAMAAADQGPVTLLRNTTYNGRLNITKNTTLDLGGYTLTSSVSHSFVVNPGQSFTLKNGTLKNNIGIAVFGLKGSSITVERDATIEAYDGIVATNSKVEEGNAIINVFGTINSTDVAIWLQGPKNTVNLDGATLTANYFALYQNGSFGGGTYNIKNSMIENGPEAGPAIYISNNKNNAENPDQGMQTLNAENSTIVGSTGIEVKFTNVTLTDCTVTATTAEPWFDQFNNGSTTAGFSVVATDNTMEPNSPAPSGTISIDGGYYKGLVGLGSLIDKEEYPDFKETAYVISGGYFTNDPSAYVASGYAAVDNSGDTVYQYKVVVAGENAAQVVTGEADVSVSESITDNDEKTLAESVADVLTNPDKGGTEQPDIGEALNAAASTVANQNPVTTEEGAEELQSAGVSIGTEDNVTIVVQPYLEISVTGASNQQGSKSVTLEITPMYKTIATTNKDNIDLTGENTKNAVQIGEPKPLTITKPVTVTIPLPENLFTGQNIYVKHSKNGHFVAYHEATIENNVLTFLNDKGFSTFEITEDNRSATVKFGSDEQVYTPVNVGDALPTATAPSGQRFAGWTFAGIQGTYTTLTDDLLNELAKLGGTIVATASFVDAPSGGSGSSDVEGSIITVSSASHGTVRVNPGRAEKGDTVTITAIPDDGYVLQSLTVTDKDGDTVRVSSEGNDKYTFTMPSGAVTVKAVFVREGSPVVTPVTSFTDVAESFWAYNEIQWAAENGYMNGTSATTFNPTGTVTRQQVWMILARMAGANPADMSAAKTWAVNNGISDGTNPGGAVTRQQLVSLLYRFAGQNGYDTSAKADLSGYPDVASLAGYATEAMAWAVANGIVGGTTQGTLNPAGTANRAQFAVILWRFYQTSAN